MLGDKVKKLRKELKITQSELAKTIGVSQSTIGMIEGNKQGASSETLMKLAKTLNTTAEYLLSENDEDNKSNLPDKINEKDKNQIEDTDGTADYNGQQLDESDLDLIESAMKIALEQIKIKNKEKFTPKKYKK